MVKVVVTAGAVHGIQIWDPRAGAVPSSTLPNRQHGLSLAACRVALELPDDLGCLGECPVELALDVVGLGGGVSVLLLVLGGSLELPLVLFVGNLELVFEALVVFFQASNLFLSLLKQRLLIEVSILSGVAMQHAVPVGSGQAGGSDTWPGPWCRASLSWCQRSSCLFPRAPAEAGLALGRIAQI